MTPRDAEGDARPPRTRTPAPPAPDPAVVTAVALHVRPQASREAWGFDPWRNRWTLSVKAPPREGRANSAALEALARALGVPPDAVTWARAGSSRDKVALVRGLDPNEVEGRLRRASALVARTSRS